MSGLLLTHRRAVRCALLLAGLCWVAGCSAEDEHAGGFAPPPPPAVTVATPIAFTAPQTLEYTGVTRSRERVTVRARVQGVIEEKHVEGGRRVKKGDLLFTIDPRPFEAAVRQAEAEVANAEALLKTAASNLRRIQGARVRNAASEFEVEQNEAANEAAEAQLALAKAVLDRARLDLGYTKVTAPLDGRLSLDIVEVGELVDPNANSRLCEIEDSSIIYAVYNVDETYVLGLRAQNETRRPGEDGRPNILVQMGLGSGDDYPFLGVTYRGNTGFNPQTGTIEVEAIFENSDGAIIPGMYCRVRPIFGTSELMLVPDVAIGGDQLGRFVLVVNEQNVVERRPIRTGQNIGAFRAITSEQLQLTDRVIINGVQRARPGAPVAPTTQTLTAPQSMPVPTTMPAGLESYLARVG